MMTFKTFLYEQLLIESEAYLELQELIAAEIDGSIASLSKKIKAWAIQQLPLASKAGNPTDLFNKIINHPDQVTSQLVKVIIDKKTKNLPVLTKKV
jgi:hypothetical protein